MSAKMTEQQCNEEVVRQLYHLADAASKDTAKFVSLFAKARLLPRCGCRKNTVARTLA